MVRALRHLARVEECHDGAAALSKLREDSFSALVTDPVTHGMRGVDLLEQVTPIAPHTARGLVSGHADTQVLTDAINRGCVEHFVPKPIEIPHFVRLIARLIKQTSPRRQRRALVIAKSDVWQAAQAA